MINYIKFFIVGLTLISFKCFPYLSAADENKRKAELDQKKQEFSCLDFEIGVVACPDQEMIAELKKMKDAGGRIAKIHCTENENKLETMKSIYRLACFGGLREFSWSCLKSKHSIRKFQKEVSKEINEIEQEIKELQDMNWSIDREERIGHFITAPL
jgi:hypothetical protein